jgi:hypothetical protein
MYGNDTGKKTCVLGFFTRGITYFDICCPTLHSFARGLGVLHWAIRSKMVRRASYLLGLVTLLPFFRVFSELLPWFLFRMSSKMACCASAYVIAIVALRPNCVSPTSRTCGGAQPLLSSTTSSSSTKPWMILLLISYAKTWGHVPCNAHHQTLL